MNIDRSKVSPMMKNYLETKDQYPDCILFYRLGDFYEMFFDDALLASKVLDIVLTGKSCGLDEKAPMCGVPFHSATSYITKLIEAGYKVAVGEQVEDPKTAKGIVKREVVKIVTPGTLIDEDSLEKTKNNYLMSIYIDGDISAVSYADISTGELNITKIDKEKIKDEVAKISPTEIITNRVEFLKELTSIADMANIYLNRDFKKQWLEKDILNEMFDGNYLEEIGIKGDDIFENSISMALNYIVETQMLNTTNFSRINIYNSSDFMVLDLFTRVNLELTKTIRGSKRRGSLLHVLDSTSTPMGARMLRKFIEQPLINREKIEYRLNVTDEIKNSFILREELKERLSKIYDLERICGKIAYDRVSPKDLVNLKNSIYMLPNIIETILNADTEYVRDFADSIDPLLDVYEIIDESILDDPAPGLKDGNIIKSGYSKELEELRDISDNGANIIKDIEAREREKTGAKTLKVGYNKVFGYYIEITKAALLQADIDDSYIRKQTLVNSERFITPELKEIEDKILNAEDKIKVIEYDIFCHIKSQIYENIDRILTVANKIAELDVYVSNASVAIKNNYCKPSINEGSKFSVKDGRHPVIEQIIGSENFITNDVEIDSGNNINIITGPNMSGKSTYMRQNALIALMAHIGSFVPATEADIPIMDRIFTRVGASDDLSQGQSTFMVEMNEVSQILKNATDRSFIILDEIGRGTSTYDGISLAWSIVEFIHDNIGAKTLFATHYHELTELENKYANIKNYSIEVKEDGDDIVFLRKIVPCAADRSYGIYVAKLAKLPEEVLERADEILMELEKNHIYNSSSIKTATDDNSAKDRDIVKEEKNASDSETDDSKRDKKAENGRKEEVIQLCFDTDDNEERYREFIDEVISFDLMNSTPMQVMNAVYELQKKAKSIR